MSNKPIPDISETLIEQCPDAMIFADIKGVIQVWNRAAVRIFGFSRDEAIGATLDIIIPESFRQAHWSGFNRSIAEGKTKYVGQSLPTKAVRADGSMIYVELGFSIVIDSAGEVVGALSNARDITTRFEKERETRKKLKAFEEGSL